MLKSNDCTWVQLHITSAQSELQHISNQWHEFHFIFINFKMLTKPGRTRPGQTSDHLSRLYMMVIIGH